MACFIYPLLPQVFHARRACKRVTKSHQQPRASGQLSALFSGGVSPASIRHNGSELCPDLEGRPRANSIFPAAIVLECI